MIKTVTIIGLTILSLYVATGTMVAQQYCGMPMSGLSLHADAKNCCDNRLAEQNPSDGPAACGIHQHQSPGNDDCNAHHCSHDTGAGFFTPSESIVVRKSSESNMVTTAVAAISDFADVMAKRVDDQTNRFLNNFSIPGIKIDFRVIYGIFIC